MPAAADGAGPSQGEDLLDTPGMLSVQSLAASRPPDQVTPASPKYDERSYFYSATAATTPGSIGGQGAAVLESPPRPASPKYDERSFFFNAGPTRSQPGSSGGGSAAMLTSNGKRPFVFREQEGLIRHTPLPPHLRLSLTPADPAVPAVTRPPHRLSQLAAPSAAAPQPVEQNEEERCNGQQGCCPTASAPAPGDASSQQAAPSAAAEGASPAALEHHPPAVSKADQPGSSGPQEEVLRPPQMQRAELPSTAAKNSPAVRVGQSPLTGAVVMQSLITPVRQEEGSRSTPVSQTGGSEVGAPRIMIFMAAHTIQHKHCLLL